MFDINNSINIWKQNLYCKNSLTNSDIEELESHLLEEIHLLNKKGLTNEESFYIACKRIGSTELISNEFRKVNIKSIFLNRIFFVIGGYWLITIIQVFIAGFYYNSPLLKFVNQLNIGYSMLITSNISILLMVIVILFYFLINQKLVKTLFQKRIFASITLFGLFILVSIIFLSFRNY